MPEQQPQPRDKIADARQARDYVRDYFHCVGIPVEVPDAAGGSSYVLTGPQQTPEAPYVPALVRTHCLAVSRMLVRAGFSAVDFRVDDAYWAFEIRREV